MAQALFYSSNAVAMTLAAGIASGDTTCNLSSTSGLPASFPFKLLIGWQTAQQEVVHCAALSGVVATISRGQDGTTAQAHSIGASVIHGVSAREFNDLESHVGASSGVHGLSGSVVGTTDAQALTNKTLNSTSTVSGAAIVGDTLAQTLTNKTLTAPAIQPSVNTGVGATVTGLASQSGDLQRWTDSTPTTLAKVTSAGVVVTTGSQVVGGVNTGSNIFAVVPVGMGLGTQFLLYRDESNAEILSLFPRGGLRSTATVNTVIPIIAKGAASQGVSLQEWQNSSGTPLAKIDQNGNLTATNVTSAWTAYTPTFTNITSGAGTFRTLTMGKTMFIRGAFSAGTVTATGTASISLPATTSSAGAASQIVLGQLGSAVVNQWITTTGSTTLSTQSLTAGTNLTNAIFSGTIELA